MIQKIQGTFVGHDKTIRWTLRPALSEEMLMDAGLSFIFAVINVYFSFKLLLNTESQTFLIKSSN
jgi:hypothetical protein